MAEANEKVDGAKRFGEEEEDDDEEIDEEVIFDIQLYLYLSTVCSSYISSELQVSERCRPLRH